MPRSTWIKAALLVGIVAAAFLLIGRSDLLGGDGVAGTAERVRALRELPGAPVIFVAIYAVVATLGLPGSALTLAGGAVFGFGAGLALNWLGAMLGAAGAYWLARALGMGAVRSLLGSRAERIDRLADQHGFLTLLRLRLIPLVPFNLLNYASGLANVRHRDFLLATGIGILPATAVYTWFADALLSGVQGARRDALVRLAIAGVLLVGLSFAPRLLRRGGG